MLFQAPVILKLVKLRVKNKHGWSIGTVYNQFTQSKKKNMVTYDETFINGAYWLNCQNKKGLNF